MTRLRELADRTPPDRERYLDLLRALAIVTVVLGHWTVTVVVYDLSGSPDGHSALPELPWAYPLTWAAQVMPVFFLVGGYANAASLHSFRARGGDGAGWLLDRSNRLVRPTTVLVLVLMVGAAQASLVGVDSERIRTVAWFATIPLWFLAAYLAVVPLTPPMYALHRRFGLAVPLGLVVLVAAGDVARFAGHETWGLGGFVFGWLAVHQVGFAWYDAHTGQPDRRRRLPTGRPAALAMLVGGLGATVLLTVPGPYPVSMLNVPGQPLHNASPPSLALLTLFTAQLGLILLVRSPVERWLHRRRPWQAVVAVNSVVLTLFLWHLTAAILLVGALDAVGRLPTPAAGSAAWFAWRVPWLLMLAAVLTALVAVFGRVEARTLRRERTTPQPTSPVRGVLVVAGYAAVVVALVVNSQTPKYAPEPYGLPVVALVAYLAGAGLLRLLTLLRPSLR
ncbi:acyltransferase family protein [Micromonospora sp. SH-82]|uniref:acyltransferase family protein n=1 Tax=Micromonospora sp. SH-82 TaxID=3132938 RepID=UPI003EB6C382